MTRQSWPDGDRRGQRGGNLQAAYERVDGLEKRMEKNRAERAENQF